MVTVRSALSDWKPSMLVRVALLSSITNASPLSGVTRLTTNAMPSALSTSSRMAR